jgi:hypothetical protein
MSTLLMEKNMSKQQSMKKKVEGTVKKAIHGDGFAKFAGNFIGEKVAVIAARYQYRGILVAVMPDCIVLSPAMAVETSGQTERDAPETEDSTSGFVCIKSDAVEILYQPRWCFAPIEGE